MVLLFLPKVTKHGTFQGPPSLEPSIGQQVGVFLRLLPSLFSKDKNLNHFSLFGCDFQFEYFKTCF
jgi:hypothetical protein